MHTRASFPALCRYSVLTWRCLHICSNDRFCAPPLPSRAAKSSAVSTVNISGVPLFAEAAHDSGRMGDGLLMGAESSPRYLYEKDSAPGAQKPSRGSPT